MKTCIGKTKISQRQCHREPFMDDYCIIHWKQKEGLSKHERKDWKDKCSKCNRPRRLLPNGRCMTCKYDR